MTEQSFNKPTEETVDTQGQQGEPNSDQGDGQDRHDPKFQLDVMQKRLGDKDTHITKIEEENQSLREQFADMEERLQNMERIKDTLDQHRNKQEPQTPDEDALIGKLEERLTARQKQQQADNNFTAVHGKLLDMYGTQEKVDEEMAKLSQSTGLGFNDLIETAKKSPQAFYKLSGIEGGTTKPAQSYTKGTMNTDGEASAGVRDRAFFARLRRENPREYFKPEVQREFRKLFDN